MRSRFASAALAVTLFSAPALVAAPALVPAASAHAVLLSSDPADGTTVDAAPDRVSLTFNEEINPSFATVAVTGADRTNRVDGDVVVEGDTVTAGVAGLDDGEVTIGYRVTSADGHVIQGSTRFTVGSGDAAGAAAPADSDTGTAESGGAGDSAESGSDAADGDASDSGAPDAAAEDSSSLGADAALWIVAGLAVLLIGAAALLLRRGRTD